MRFIGLIFRDAVRCSALALLFAGALALAVGACSDDGGTGVADAGDSSTQMPISCGDTTCAANEYCYEECLCCGFPTDAAPRSNYACRAIPNECDPADICGCASIPSMGLCDRASRSVRVPCA